MNTNDDPSPLCFLCEQEPGTVEALCDDEPVLVCASCFAYETGEEPEAQDDEAA